MTVWIAVTYPGWDELRKIGREEGERKKVGEIKITTNF